jgi:hypothetical protein
VSQERSQKPPQKHDGTTYENTELCWAYLQEAGAMARYLKLVPAGAFEDRRNPPPKLFMQPGMTHEPPTVELGSLAWWSLLVTMMKELCAGRRSYLLSGGAGLRT